jgi:hypothetical protein
MKTINRNNATPPGINQVLPFVGGSSKTWMQGYQAAFFFLLFSAIQGNF